MTDDTPAPTLSFEDGLFAAVVPIYGVVIGLKCLVRDQVGKGLALLVLAAIGTAGWQLAISALT